MHLKQRAMILLLFLLAVTAGKFVPPPPAYSIVPAAPRIREPCWIDIDGTERVAILFDYSLLMDTVLLGGEQSVGFRVRTHSLYIEPSFVQRLEYQCKTRFGNTPAIAQQQVNATFTCAYYFATYSPLSEQIPIECYNSTYVYLNDTELVIGDSPAECSLFIETHCMTTHSEVLNISCYTMFNYTNGITNCNVWCRCASFVQAMVPAPTLGITPPPTFLNCTDYFENNRPPWDLAKILACQAIVDGPVGCVSLNQSLTCPFNTSGRTCYITLDGNPPTPKCCTCAIYPVSTPAPTSVPPTPAPTIRNCTDFFENAVPPYDPAIVSECNATVNITDCDPVPVKCGNPNPGQICTNGPFANVFCCYCVTLPPDSLPPTPAPTALPTTAPTFMPTFAPTAIGAPTALPTSAPTAIGAPTATPTAMPTAVPTTAPTAMPTIPTSSPSPTTTSPSPSPAPTTDASSLSGGEIIGIVLFVVVGLLIIALFIAILCVRRSKGTTYFRF